MLLLFSCSKEEFNFIGFYEVASIRDECPNPNDNAQVNATADGICLQGGNGVECIKIELNIQEGGSFTMKEQIGPQAFGGFIPLTVNDFEGTYTTSENIITLNRTTASTLTMMLDEKLEVSGGIRLETASSAMPHEGTIQWNEDTQDFEGYNGTEWLSLTKKCSSTGSMNTGPPVPPMCCEESYTNIDGGESDAFGRSVAIYGNYGSVAQFSAVHLFIFGGNSWMLDTSISVDFQSSTALDTSWALIGNIDLSEIIILQNNSDHWNVYDTLQASDAVIGDDFGWSVGVSGEYLIAGAPRAEFDGDVSRGKVFFFHNISGSWTETAKLPYSEGNANDFLGASVDISGSYAVAGASDHDSYGDMNRGIVVVYELNGNIWGESDTLHMPNGTSLAQFGRSVSIEDDYIVVGAPGAVNSAGNAYIFKRNGSNWELDATLQAPDGVAGDQFGASVSISGDYVIVGAPFHDINGKVDQGAAYIFHYDGTTWNQIEKLTDPVGLAGDRYGNAVATDSANRLVGAPTASANGNIGRGKVIFGPID